MPLPPTPRQKRKSLPTDLDHYSQEDSEIASGSKRQRHEQGQNSGKISRRRSRANHKRSSTLGNPILSIGPRGTITNFHSSRLDTSHLDNGIFLSHSLMQKARNLIGRPKLDTTRTDYFNLKSRGIDPDTPFVPLTKRKRPSEDSSNSSNKLPRTSPPSLKSRGFNPNTPLVPLTKRKRPSEDSPNVSNKLPRTSPPNSFKIHSKSPPPSATEPKDGSDSDEALFAQMRQVREAMADSISWYQAERAKHELATASSSPRPETAKEKRLREFRFTPSRTEQRLKATGANGFLPKNWNGVQSQTLGDEREESIEDGGDESSRDSQAEEEEYESSSGSHIEDQGIEHSGHIGGQWSSGRHMGIPNQAKGSSADDAIEL